MATTSGWVPVIVAVLGIAGTLGAAVWTQSRADRRESERLQAERDREQAVWAREDRARTVERREAAYAEFMSSWRDAYMGLPSEYDAPDGYSTPENWLVPTWHHLQMVHLYGSDEARQLAEAAFDALSKHGLDLRDWGPADDAMKAFTEQVRKDLGVITG